MSSLLPDSYSSFRSKEYWDDFFTKKKSFEWYGTYNDIQPFLRKSIQSLSNSILILGCGNSDFSSLLYDDGYHRITNIDFSELVIEEMKVKNISRHKMKWLVQDMTSMSKSLVIEEKVVAVVGEDDVVSYDIIFDKGALDALHSMDTSESHHEACKMFHEIDTLLNESSRYICITLAQGFILQSLLHYFLQFNNDDDSTYFYRITIHRLHTKVESALLPFYIELQKLSKAKTISTINHNTKHSPSIFLFVNHFSESIDHPLQFNSKDNDITSVVNSIAVIQNYYQKQIKLTQFQLGRFEIMNYYSNEHPEIPRFTLYIFDYTSTAPLSSAVFMIPTGREADYQFTTIDGLQEVASQANCCRLIAVSCNRPHIFPEMMLLQKELSPIIMNICFKLKHSSDESIPFLAIGGDTDWDEIERGVSSESGVYVVEERIDDTQPNSLLRRLVFLQNQYFIQTEVRLVLRPNKSDKHQHSNSNSKSKTKSNKSGSSSKSKGKSKSGSVCNGMKTSSDGVDVLMDELEFDYGYLDDHHRSALSVFTLFPHVIKSSYKVVHTNIQQQQQLKHHHQGQQNNYNQLTSSASVLLIGLGGGALPMSIQRYLPNLRLTIIDLDSSIEMIARKHFGFKLNNRSKYFVREGVAYIEHIYNNLYNQQSIESLNKVKTTNVNDDDGRNVSINISSLDVSTTNDHDIATQLDLIFIDCDGKDSSSGISAPPSSFITVTTLFKIYSILKDGGGVYINIVARNKHQLGELLVKIGIVFNVPISLLTGKSISKICHGLQCDTDEVMRLKAEIDTCIINMKHHASISSNGDDGRCSDDNNNSSRSIGDNDDVCSSTYTCNGVGRMFHLMSPSADTINEGLLLIKGSSSTTTTTSSLSTKTIGGSKDACVNSLSSSLSQIELEKTLSQWLPTINLGHDPLKISDVLSNIVEVKI